MRYAERLVDAGIAPSVGGCGNAYANALAESAIGLCRNGSGSADRGPSPIPQVASRPARTYGQTPSSEGSEVST